MPSWRNFISSTPTTSLSKQTVSFLSLVNSPITVASTPSLSPSVCSAAQFSGGTASTIRSWLSDTQISQGASPWYFNGTFSKSTRTPVSLPSSPTADENPPAPQS